MSSPGNSRGKAKIGKAYQSIARHFGNALRVTQGKAHVLEGGDTTLVIMETRLHVRDSAPIIRHATYVFSRNEAGAWLCTVDNSYGTDLLDVDYAVVD